MRNCILAALLIATSANAQTATPAISPRDDRMLTGLAHADVLDRACPKVRVDWTAAFADAQVQRALKADGAGQRIHAEIEELTRSSLPEEWSACAQLANFDVPLINE